MFKADAPDRVINNLAWSELVNQVKYKSKRSKHNKVSSRPSNSNTGDSSISIN